MSKEHDDKRYDASANASHEVGDAARISPAGPRRRVWLWVSGAVVALGLYGLLFGGVAMAQSEDDTTTSLAELFIERLAENLGITTDELSTTIDETRDQVLDEAVESGQITQEQADRIRECADSNGGPFGFNRGWGPGHFPRGDAESSDESTSEPEETESDVETTIF